MLSLQAIREDDRAPRRCGGGADASSAHAREKHGTKKGGFPSRYLSGPDCLFHKDVISSNHPPRVWFQEVIFLRSIVSWLPFVCRQFRDSAASLRRTRTLTTVGVLLAIQMVLSSYGVIEVNDSLKISLAHLALAPTAMLFGPVAAGLQGALSDILGFLLKPTGPYFPGFTLSALLGGVIYGMVFYRTQCRLWQIVLARLLIIVLVNICLNTVFLTMLYGPSRLATLPLRAFKNIIQLPFDCVLLTSVCRLMRRVPATLAAR